MENIFECSKVGDNTSGGDRVLRIKLQRDDMAKWQWLISAPVGTRFNAGFVEIGDDQ